MTQLGPFRLLRVAGRGGAGVVYAAEHASGRPVAIKVIPKQFTAVALHEVRATAALRHPNVVQVLDFGEVPAGLDLPERSTWFAMEWVSGGTLADAPPSSWVAFRAGLAGVLSALGWLHARGQLHRDLKPTNLLLPGPADPRDGWKLTDFGISWTRDTQASPDSGTPAFMAPEQLSRGALGSWTDLYGLGATAWAAITGQFPFAGHGADLARAIQTAPLRPFAPRFPVPVGTEAWLARLLARSPRQRYRYAIDALDDMPDGEPRSNGVVAFGDEVPQMRTPTLAVAIDPAAPVIVDAARPMVTPPQPTTHRSIPPTPPDEAPLPPRDYLPGAGDALIGLADPPLVGHRDARAQLWAALKTSFDNWQFTRVALTGATGTGRRRVAEWLGSAAHALGLCRCSVVSGDPGPDGDLAGWMRSTFGLSTLPARYDPATETGRKLVEAWLSGRRADARVEAWAALLDALDDEGPRRVLIVDNADRAHEVSRFLAWVADRGPRPWIVVEIRDEAGDLPQVELLPLTQTAIVELGARLGLSEIATLKIAVHSGGLPGTFVHLCAHVSRQGGWEHTHQGLEIRPGTDLSLLPTTEWPTDRPALAIAAALAPTIDIAEWQEACRIFGLDPVAEVGPLLDLAVVPVDGHTWRFREPSAVDAYLSRVPDRARVHAAAASAILGDGHVASERRAAQQVAAGRYAEARPALLAAARRAHVRSDMITLDRCATLLAVAAESDPEANACEHFCRASVAQWRGQPNEAILLAAERFVDDAPEWVVRCRKTLAISPSVGPRTARAREAATSALELALERCDVAVQSEALLWHAVMFINVDPALSLRESEIVMANATKLGDDAMLAGAARAAGSSATFLKNYPRALKYLETGLAAAQRSDTATVRALLLCELGNLHELTGEFEKALVEYHASMTELARLGHTSEVIAGASYAMTLLALGRSDEARRCLEGLLPKARAKQLLFTQILQACLLQWDAREKAWERWDERWAEAERIMTYPFADLHLAAAADAAADAALASGDDARAADARRLAEHVRTSAKAS
jgi:tetratricopeptide (TPR) repeat protein